MSRFLILLLGMLTTRARNVGAGPFRAEDSDGANQVRGMRALGMAPTKRGSSHVNRCRRRGGIKGLTAWDRAARTGSRACGGAVSRAG